MQFPNDRTYSESHEWLKIEEGIATVGLTDFAQSQLGEVVFVNLPEEGDEVEGGESFSDVESVKAVSEVISPVSGTVIEINEELLDNPGLINEAPYDAWFIKVEASEAAVETMDNDAYEASCEAE